MKKLLAILVAGVFAASAFAANSSAPMAADSSMEHNAAAAQKPEMKNEATEHSDKMNEHAKKHHAKKHHAKKQHAKHHGKKHSHAAKKDASEGMM